MQRFFEGIAEMCRDITQITKMAITQLKSESDAVICSRCKDDKII